MKNILFKKSRAFLPLCLLPLFAHAQGDGFVPKINELPAFSLPVQYMLEWKMQEWTPFPAPQVVSNNCASATMIPICPNPSSAPGCQSGGSTNTATLEIGETTACAPSIPAPTQSLWAYFTTGPTITGPILVNIIQNPQNATPCISTSFDCCAMTTVVWESISGGCPMIDPCKMISCQSSANGPTNPPGPIIMRQRHELSVDELQPNTRYYIQFIYAPGGACGNRATFNYSVTDGTAYTDITNPRPVKTCVNPGGSLCNIVNPLVSTPSFATVQASCTAIADNPARDTVNQVKRECMVVNSNMNTTLKFTLNFKAKCIAGPVSWLYLKVYPVGSCTPIFCGYGGIITVPGLSCNTLYNFCYQYEISQCSDTSHTPYTWGPNTSCPLPVELLQFTAKYIGSDGVQLDWATASEQNNAKFILERKGAKEDFMPIAEFPGHGTTTTTTSYQAIDRNPRKGMNMYRLCQVDFNGQETRSEVRTVMVGENSAELYYFAHFIHVASASPAVLQLFDQMGKVHLRQELGEGEHEFDVAHLSTGIYVAVITPTLGLPIMRKIVVQ